jgi:hypothetical protein
MKAYKFTIHACEAERGSSNMVIYSPMSILYHENFEGTVDELANRIQSIKNELIKLKPLLETGKGFSINPILLGGQRKPAGYDVKRRQIATNYIV